MRRFFTLLPLATCLIFGSLAAEEFGDDIDLDKLSEAFGHFIGRNLNPPGLKFNVDSVIRGIRNGAEGKPAPMEEQEYEEAMGKLQILAFQKLSENNLKEANTFLEENGKKAGIIEIEPSKLQYSITSIGTGPVVEEHFSPSINYVGTYLDGNVFGSSEETGGATTISLDQTIPGFHKGLVGMKEGGKSANSSSILT